MAKRKNSDSESESEDEEKLSSEEGADNSGSDGEGQKPEISEYEKQRLARIAENRARMVALGLPNMASSLMGSSQNSTQNSRTHKGKRKAAGDDEDYRPNHEDDHDDDDDEELDNDDQNDDDEEFLGNNASRSRKKKVKNKGPKSKKIATITNNFSSSDFVDDDKDLMKAIALSLQESSQDSCVVHKDAQDATFGERKGNTRMKKKKSFASRVQMNEDEMIMHFFMFDEAGKGGITVRDLQRVAVAHDFMWTDKELADMIHCFDGNGAGKLTLQDFRKIVSRCNMLQPS
ncbi:hypothetical protein SLE2022_177960 [Rubroshorea leprosula]